MVLKVLYLTLALFGCRLGVEGLLASIREVENPLGALVADDLVGENELPLRGGVRLVM